MLKELQEARLTQVRQKIPNTRQFLLDILHHQKRASLMEQ